MAVSNKVILAPLDPFFKPSYKMFDALCQFMLDKQIIYEEVNERHQSSLFNFQQLDLFPPNFKLPHPNDWTQDTIDLYGRLFLFGWTYLTETDQVIDHYTDEDQLRPPLQEFPNDSLDPLKCDQLVQLQPYLEGNYLLKGTLHLHPLQDDLLCKQVEFSLRGCGLQIRQGMHFDIQEIPLRIEDAYWRCFPYAPKCKFRNESDHDFSRLTYVGSFSMTLFFLNPLFDDFSQYWPEDMTGEKNVRLFREHSSYYKLLKPAMEEIFQTPVDLFIGLDV